MEGIKYKKGFTLIEVILSIAILSIIIGPILSLTLSTVKINKQSDDKLKAINIAQKHLEEIKASNYKIQPDATFPIQETKSENSFDVERLITPIEEYKLNEQIMGNEIATFNAEVKNSTVTNSNISDILDIRYITFDKLEIRLNKAIGTEVNVKVQLTDAVVSNDVNIDLINNSSVKLNAYFTKDSKKYSISKCVGDVNVYTNTPENMEVESDKYRLYKIIVEVKKGSKSLQKIEGYKTCLK